MDFAADCDCDMIQAINMCVSLSRPAPGQGFMALADSKHWEQQTEKDKDMLRNAVPLFTTSQVSRECDYLECGCCKLCVVNRAPH